MEGLNPARPGPGVALCPLAEIADPGTKGFIFRQGDRLFAGLVARKEGAVFGYVDSCPHNGWPLGGPTGRHLTKAGDLILCSGHGALFRIEDGECTSGPCAGERLQAWAVDVIEGRLVTA